VKTFIKSNPGINGKWSLVKSGDITKIQQDEHKFTTKYGPTGQLSFSLPPMFTRFQLRSYGELITFNMHYTSDTGILANWTLHIQPIRGKTVQFLVHPSPSTNVTTYSVRLHETYASTNISARELQEVLADVFTMTLRGEFNSNGTLSLSDVKLHTAVSNNTGEYAGNVDNCTCNDDNYTSLSCELCSEGKVVIAF
jgi:hypothetical protein